jgi:hypothetical protein
MKLLILVIIAISVFLTVIWWWNGGIDWPHLVVLRWYVTQEKVDHDFMADIYTTSDPEIVKIRVRKINPNVDKLISFVPVQVDVVFKDSHGKVYSGPVGIPTYAKAIDLTFGLRNVDSRNIEGRVRLVKAYLPPGTYTVTPKVRIVESGKDMITGPYRDGGSVAVPSANSLRITVR